MGTNGWRHMKFSQRVVRNPPSGRGRTRPLPPLPRRCQEPGRRTGGFYEPTERSGGGRVRCRARNSKLNKLAKKTLPVKKVTRHTTLL